MRSYGIELYVEERARDLLREAEQERLLQNAGRAVRSEGTRRRFSPTAAVRRLAQLAWEW